jgi:hypothetical protein
MLREEGERGGSGGRREGRCELSVRTGTMAYQLALLYNACVRTRTGGGVRPIWPVWSVWSVWCGVHAG